MSSHSQRQANWERFIASPPPGVTLLGDFPEALLARNILIASAGTVRIPRGEWMNVPASFSEFIQYASKTREGEKDGLMFCQGSVRNGIRDVLNMDKMYLVGADMDSGYPMQQAADQLRALGIFSLILPSYSWGSLVSKVSYAELERHLGRKGVEPTLDEVKALLRHQGRYVEKIIDSVVRIAVVVEKRKKIIRFWHDPIEKYRIITILDEPFEQGSFSDAEAANCAWGSISMGLATLIGASADPSCKDISRAFYFPAKPVDAPDRPIMILGGRAISANELIEAANTLAEPLEEAAPNTEATSSRPQQKSQSRITKVGGQAIPTWLFRWAVKYGKKFRAATAIKHYSPDYLGGPAKRGKGIHFLCCPLSERHSNPYEDDSASFICDARENGPGFQIRCMHGGCIELDRLDFINRLLKEGILPRDALTNFRFYIGSPPSSVGRSPVGDGLSGKGFCGPIEELCLTYFRRFGLGHRVDLLKARVREILEKAPRLNRTQEEMARYSSDEFLDNLIIHAQSAIAKELST